MMITDLAVVDYLFGINRYILGVSKFRRHFSCEIRNHIFHIFCKKTTVRSGIGHQFLFIKALRIIKCLLCRESQKTVGISLQCSKAIELRCLFLLVCRINFYNLCGFLFFQHFKNVFCILFLFKTIRYRGDPTTADG